MHWCTLRVPSRQLCTFVEYKFFAFSECNSTHSQTSKLIEKRVKEKLPQLFQDHLLCAGTTVGRQGSCKGDSGGPLLYYDRRMKHFIQIATVEGGVRDCGDEEYPGIYVRLDHPSVLDFITSTTLVSTISKEPIQEEIEKVGNKGRQSMVY